MFKSAINVIRNSVACTKEIINYELLQNIWGISLKLTDKKSCFVKIMEASSPGTKKIQKR